MKTSSEKLFARAQQVLVGGVNSSVRAFRAVGGTPVFFSHAQGPYLKDYEDKYYIDYVGSWGSMVLGHTHQHVVQAIREAATHALSFGAPTLNEIVLAEFIQKAMPSLERIRLVSSGTEATMHAIRLARGFTERDKIIKFNGCYHGAHDNVLVKAGSGLLTFGIPNCKGIPESIAAETLVAEFNNLNSVEKIFDQHKNKIAAVIIEPIAGNMGCVLPQGEFLKNLKKLCESQGSLLILDEVMTGFRVALGGAQSLYGITPDLTTLAKVIGGGLPVAAFGGRADIMAYLSPEGPVYQAGTLSGNPVAMAAGIATLEMTMKPGFYENLAITTSKLTQGIKDIAAKQKIPLVINEVCGMFSLFFTEQKAVVDFESVIGCDHNYFKSFFHAMLQQGIYLPPSSYEAWFISAAHDNEEINLTLEAVEKVFANSFPKEDLI